MATTSTPHRRAADRAGSRRVLRRIRARALSSLQLISATAFARGLAALEAHGRALPATHVFAEPVDVLVFRR